MREPTLHEYTTTCLNRLAVNLGEHFHGVTDLHEKIMRDVEKPLLTFALAKCGGNQILAAQVLGINRNTLRKRMRKYGLPFPRGHYGHS